MEITFDLVKEFGGWLFAVGCTYAVMKYKIDQLTKLMYDEHGAALLPTILKRLDDHHKVLYDERGFPQFFTKNECRENHAEELAKFGLRLELIQNNMDNLRSGLSQLDVIQKNIQALEVTLAQVLTRIQKNGGNRMYDTEK